MTATDEGPDGDPGPGAPAPGGAGPAPGTGNADREPAAEDRGHDGGGPGPAAEGREPGTGGRGPAPGTGNADRGREDVVAGVVRQWSAVRPDVDTGPMEVIGRINRCAALLQQAEDAPLRRAGLSRGEFDVLGTLRRTGHELTPGEIARETFSSGAAVTKRLRQLGERGLVERRADARDRRVALVRLTEEGRGLVDGLLPEQLSYESAVLSGVDAPRQADLAHLLSDLLVQLEGRLGLPRG